jgi:uncharacterized protein (DUF427 family)
MRPTAPPRPPSKPEPLIEDLRFEPPLATVRMEFRPAERRVRAFLGRTAVAASTGAMLTLETARLRVYYLPVEDVRTDLFPARIAHHRLDPQGGRCPATSEEPG